MMMNKSGKRRNNAAGRGGDHQQQFGGKINACDPQQFTANETMSLPKLTYGKTSNFHEWSKTAFQVTTLRFGMLARLIRDDEYWMPLPINHDEAYDDEDLAEENDPFGFLRARIIDEMKARDKIIRQMNEDRPKFFAAIYSSLSIESEQMVIQQAAADDNLDQLRAATDPLFLYRLIRQTHIVTATGHDVIDRNQAVAKYHQLQQGAQEATTRFKERMDYAIEALKALAVPVPAEADQAAHFISRLDKGRYVSLQAELQNSLNMGFGVFPPTLTAAYNLALNYQVVSTIGGVQSNVTSSASVFMVNAAHNTKKHKKNNGKNKNNSLNVVPGCEGKSHSRNATSTSEVDCFTCGETGHFARDCPNKAEMRRLLAEHRNRDNGRSAHHPINHVSNMMEEASIFHTFHSGARRRPGPYDVLLDNQASISIFSNPELVSNVRKTSHPVAFAGVSGEQQVARLVADLAGFGTVYFHPSLHVNIVCYADAEDRCNVKYIPRSHFSMMFDGDKKETRFIRHGKLYVADFYHRRTSHSSVVLQLATVEDMASSLTKRDMARVEKVIEVVKRLGYPSLKQLSRIVASGAIIGLDITTKDIANAMMVHGSGVAYSKGRSKAMTPKIYNDHPIPRPIHQAQTLFCDVFFVNLNAFLLSVSQPLGFLIVDLLSSRKAEALCTSLKNHIRIYQEESFLVSGIVIDGESGLIRASQAIKEVGIKVDVVAAGAHVGRAEVWIRVIKERARTIFFSLPYKLPSFLLPWLICFSTSRINMAPSNLRVDQISPVEALKGRKIEYKRDLPLNFGQYCQVVKPGQDLDKSSVTVPRSEGAIALLPLGGANGAVKFFCIDSKSYVNRHKWIPLPMNEEEIKKINIIAESSAKGPVVMANNEEQEDGDVDTIIPANLAGGTMVSNINEEVNADANQAPEEVQTNAEDQEEVQQGELIPDEGADDQQEEDQEEHREAMQQSSAPTTSQSSSTSSLSLPTVHNYNLRRDRRRSMTSDYVYSISAKSPERQMFEDQAIKTELTQMLDKNVWRPVHWSEVAERRPNTQIIRSFIFVKEKTSPTGDFIKMKARLVAGGNHQDRALYDDVSAHTVSMTALFMVASLAAREYQHVTACDIAGAYLNASLDADTCIYMILGDKESRLLCDLDHEYAKYVKESKGGKKSITVRLIKALYGCLESGRLWKQHLTKTLERIGFCACKVDPCVLRHRSDRDRTILALYVDDVFIASTHASGVQRVINALKNAYKDITVSNGPVLSYLGMSMEFAPSLGSVKLTMKGYVEDILRDCPNICTSAKTPATGQLFDISDNDHQVDAEQKDFFHAMVARLLYLAKRTRPDILTAISFLSTRVACCTREDMAKLERVIRYLRGTTDLGIVLKAAGDDIRVSAYIDASFAPHGDAKSHTGAMVTIGDGPIYVRSAKQKIVSKSSAEAEIVAVADEVSQVIWCSDLLKELGYKVLPSIVYQDNTAAIKMAESGSSQAARSRHINVRYYFIKQHIDANDIKVVYLKTGDMVADILTKPLQGYAFKKLRSQLLNWNV